MGASTGKGANLTRRSFLRGSACGLISAAFTGAYADYDVHNTQLEHVEITLPRWKADGLRVGFISDIHVNDPDEMVRAQRAAQMLAETKPDLLLFGGDCVNSKHPEGLENIPESFEPFRTLKCPKLAILGNHDYACGALPEVERLLGESGFLLLKNETATFNGFAVAGYDDQAWGVRDLTYRPTHEGTIALIHEPDLNGNVPQTVSLQLSGHSHGGQICLPFGTPVHAPYGARKYRRGLYRNGAVPLYVTRGVGTTGFKWRMFCPPEVTLLTLRSAL